jgi:hypothetical protein
MTIESKSWIFKTLMIVVTASLVLSCHLGNSKGTLTVSFVGNGNYEIYKIANEQPLQFVSETTTPFNEKVSLSPGSYMILADCSSEIVNIYPGSDVVLTAHAVNFIPLQPPGEKDKFSVQCTRSERTRTRQNLQNHFSLTVLAGTRDLLVGMIPLRLELSAAESKESRVVSYVLSSISVAATENKTSDGFFVSPVGEINPYTESQSPGSKLYVLSGSYDLQLNGTEMTVELREGESRIIEPATLVIETSKNVDLARAEKVKGAPLFAEINGEHYMELNTTYAVLPGTIDVRLSSSLRPTSFDIEEGEKLTVHARNVLVDLGCVEDDWACLGSRKIRLFEKDKNYHFAESQSDSPILFLEKDVALGIEGSRNIKLGLSAGDDLKVKVGFLEVTPSPSFKAGVLTDLMRVEPSGGGLHGASLDMVLDKPTTMPLVAGYYQLAQYTFTSADGGRRKSTQGFHISPCQTVKLNVQTHLSEKKMALFSAGQEDSSKQ